MAVLLLVLMGAAACFGTDNRVHLATGVGPGVGDDAVILLDEDGVVLVSADGLSWAQPRPFPNDTSLDAPTVTITVSPGDAPRTRPGPTCDPDRRTCYDASAVRGARQRRSVACTADERECFRVVPGEWRIEKSADGGRTWSTEWEIVGPRRERYADALAKRVSRYGGYDGDVGAALACTSLYLVPTSGVVVAACGLLGFVRRDTDGGWQTIGFDGIGADVGRLDWKSDGDHTNDRMIVVFGWFILLLSAEAYALAHRRDRAGARVWTAVIFSLLYLPSILIRTGEPDGWGGLAVSAIFYPLLAAGTLAWLVLYTGRRSFPWWLVPLSIAVPVAGGYVHRQITDGDLGWTPGWIAIWLVTLTALAANLALAILVPPRPRVPPVLPPSRREDNRSSDGETL